MAKKKQWFLLGALGTVFGLAIKLLRGRRQDTWEAGRWEEYAPPSGGWEEPTPAATGEEAAS